MALDCPTSAERSWTVSIPTARSSRRARPSTCLPTRSPPRTKSSRLPRRSSSAPRSRSPPNPPCERSSRTSSARSSRSIDEVSQDELLEAGASEEAKQKAKALVTSFKQFLVEHKDEIDALQFFYAPAVLEASALQGHQGTGRGDQGPPALMDTREALAGLRDPRQGQGSGGIDQAAAHGHRLVGAVRPAAGQGARAVWASRSVTASISGWHSSAIGTETFTPEQVRWLEIDARPHRHEPGDDGRGPGLTRPSPKKVGMGEQRRYSARSCANSSKS